MNPFQMPKAFCIVQTFVIYYTSWSLTGICAAITFATSSSVLRPSSRKRPAASTLAWKNKYYFPIFVFPLACLSISLPVLLRVDAIQPTDDLHCDASHPEWGRFLGYAGFPMIITIPCLFLSAAAARRLHQLHRGIQRSRYSFRHTIGRLSDGQNVSREGIKSTCVDPEILYPSQPTGDTADVGNASHYDATALSPSTSQKQSEPWEVLDSATEDVFDPRRQMGSMALTLSSVSSVAPPPQPNFATAIRRLILFQMAFFITQCLAALSTVIDVARHKPAPTPFGSQHVALILVGWGPVLVFGHLPAVRRQLMFWKR
ncbi:hypothetical protein EV363DRAFT_1155959 [Boletus edulis]|nr:hypothetical protein EV363DRAFT_1155959 [Boletus edulis]